MTTPLFQDIRDRVDERMLWDLEPETYEQYKKLLEAIDVMAAALESTRSKGFNPFGPSSETSDIAAKALAHVRRLSEGAK